MVQKMFSVLILLAAMLPGALFAQNITQDITGDWRVTQPYRCSFLSSP